MADYKMRWGHYDAYDIVHFLLKYRYTENWERELNENYSPLCCAGKINDLLNLYSKNTGSHYEQIYGHQYLLPYIRETVLEILILICVDVQHIIKRYLTDVKRNGVGNYDLTR